MLYLYFIYFYIFIYTPRRASSWSSLPSTVPTRGKGSANANNSCDFLSLACKLEIFPTNFEEILFQEFINVFYKKVNNIHHIGCYYYYIQN